MSGKVIFFDRVHTILTNRGGKGDLRCLEFTHFSSEEVRLTLKTKGEVRFWKWFWAFSVRTALAVVKVEQCCETRQ